MFSKKTKLLFLTILTAMLFSVAVGVSAQPLDFGVSYGGDLGFGTRDLRSAITSIVKILLGFLGIVALLVMLYGGFVWMTAGGRADKISKAKLIIINGIIGLIIIFSSYGIVLFVTRTLIDATGGDPGVPGDPGGGPGDPGLPLPGWCEDKAKLADPTTTAPYVCDIIPDNGGLESGVTIRGYRFGSDAGKVVFEHPAIGVSEVELISCPLDGGVRWLENSIKILVKEKPLQPELVIDPLPYVVHVENSAGVPDSNEIVDGGYAPKFKITGAIPGPAIFCIDPSSAKNGDPLDIYGARLGSGAAGEVVTFNDGGAGVDVNAAALWEPNKITGVTIPPPAITGDVTVTVGPNTSNPDLLIITCDVNGECASGCCAGNACHELSVCFGVPTITYVSPSDDAGTPDIASDDTPLVHESNLITIYGEDFLGALPPPGTVTFCGDDADGDGDFCNDPFEIEGVDPGLINANCTNYWTDTTITVQVPVGAVLPDGPIMVIRSDAMFDRTNDTHGPSISNATDDGVPRPGLCAFDTDNGAFGDTRIGEGINIDIVGPDVADIDFGVAPSIISALSVNPLSATQIQFDVPNIASKSNISVRVKNPGDVYSNALPFDVVSGVAGPNILSFTPDTGPEGRYVTITGSGFRASRGANGTVIFCDGINCDTVTGAVEGDFTFPAACADSFWSDTQIIVKVPVGAPASGFIEVRTNAGGTDTTSDLSPSNFTVVGGVPGPQLCKLQPNNGPEGLDISLFGENFGGAIDTITFWNGVVVPPVDIASWADEQIDAKVPFTAVTGPVNVTVGAAPPSNQLNFSVGMCEPVACEASGVNQCCGDGSCRPAGTCPAPPGVVTSTYSFRFSTGVLPTPPHVVEQCLGTITGACEDTDGDGTDDTCSNNGLACTVSMECQVLPSPSPSTLWSGGTQVCPNMGVLEVFSDEIDFTTLRDPADFTIHPNILLEECTDGTCTVPVSEVDMSVVFVWNTTNHNPVYGSLATVFVGVPLDGAGSWTNLDIDTWYRLIIKDSVTNLSGDSLTRLNFDYDGSGTLDSYRSMFKTSNDLNCEFDLVSIIPPSDIFTQLLEEKDFLWAPQDSKYFCQVAWPPGGSSQVWSSNDVARVDINPLFVNSNPTKVQALAETLPDIPVHINVDATIGGVTRSSFAEVTVEFADPYVIDQWPMCETACLNAEIAVLFNIGMDNITFGGVELRDITGGTPGVVVMTDPDPVKYTETDIIDLEAGAITKEYKHTVSLLPAGTELNPNSLYRAIYPDTVESASNKLLTHLNYNSANDVYCGGEWDEYILDTTWGTDVAVAPVADDITGNVYYFVDTTTLLPFTSAYDSATERLSTLEVWEDKGDGFKKLNKPHEDIENVWTFGVGRYIAADDLATDLFNPIDIDNDSINDLDPVIKGLYFTASDNTIITDPVPGNMNGYMYKIRYQPLEWQDCNAYAWDFGTKDKACEPDRLAVQPREAELHTIGATQDYVAEVYSSPDECSIKGQLLDASAYDPNYAWSSSDAAVASIIDSIPPPPVNEYQAGAQALSGASGGSTVDIESVINPPGLPAALSCTDTAECGELTVVCGYVSDSQCGVPPGNPIGTCDDTTGDGVGDTCSNDPAVACLYDNDCNFGVGDTTCCYQRPYVTNFEPTAGGVCRNARIFAEFSEVMNTSSYTDNTLLEANYTLEGNCPPGAGLAVLPDNLQPQGFFSRAFAYVKDLWNKLLGKNVRAVTEVWCKLSHSINREATTVDLVPGGILESDREYRVTLNDTQSGLDNGLVAHWTFDDDVLDSSGNGYHGVESGTAFLAGAPGLGQSIEFNAPGDMITVSDPLPEINNLDTQVSFSAWVNPTSIPNSFPRILGKEVANDDRFFFSLRGDGFNTIHANINGEINFKGVDNAIINGVWQHVAFTYNGTEGILFVNGVEVGRQSVATQIKANNADLMIGDTAFIAPREFDGAIDDVRIYDRALNEQEILSLTTGNTAEGISVIRNGSLLTTNVESFYGEGSAQEFYGYRKCDLASCAGLPGYGSMRTDNPVVAGGNIDTSTMFTYRDVMKNKTYIGMVHDDPSVLPVVNGKVTYRVVSVTPGVNVLDFDDADSSFGDKINGETITNTHLPVTLQAGDVIEWGWDADYRTDGVMIEAPRGDWHITLQITGSVNLGGGWRFRDLGGSIGLVIGDTVTIRHVSPKSIQSAAGVAMDGIKTWNFTTGTEICQIARVETTIHAPDAGAIANVDLFNCAELNNCDGDQADGATDLGGPGTEPNEPGNQHHYSAQAKSADGDDLLADYVWDKSDANGFITNFWDTTNLPAGPGWAAFPGAVDAQNVYLDTNTTNGSALVTVTATDPLGLAGTKTANIRVINFMCQNPWPELANFPYQDTNANCDVTPLGPGTCANTNFETFYCRDVGSPDIEDDLPLLANPGVGDDTVTGVDDKKVCFGGTRVGEVCTNADNCPGICKNGYCEVGTDDDSCNTSTGLCNITGIPCPIGNECILEGTIGQACTNDADCVDGQINNLQICGPLQIKNIIIPFE